VGGHELQFRIAVECSAKYNADHVERGFDMPTLLKGVHLPNSFVAKVTELSNKPGTETAQTRRLLFGSLSRAFEESRTREVLLKGYGAHNRLLLDQSYSFVASK
jgi:hypothetical protein